MNKPAKQPAAAPAPAETTESKTIVVHDQTMIRDEFAMRMAAAIVTGIVQRGGVDAIEAAYGDDSLMRDAYFYADMALRVRAA